jgi:hypothetical protein
MNLHKVGSLWSLQVFLALFLVSWSCERNPAPVQGKSSDFESTPQSSGMTPGIIDEASGLAPSSSLAGSLWTIQDSGQPNSVYLISQDGKSIKQYNLPGSTNHDWEDLAVGPGPASGVKYIYVADIGNNNLPMTSSNTIYRIPEISDLAGSFKQTDLEKISFKYPDGPRDAESILVDPMTKDIFIISKETDKAGIYRLAFPQSLTETTNAERLGTIPSVLFATGGTVSVDGSEILMRTYLGVYYWQRKTGETVGQTLLRAADKQLSVALEPQGEGICFDLKGDGFYTISEKANASAVSLNYYKRR